MGPKEKQAIIDALTERDANKSCPRCGSLSFELADGYFNQTVQSDIGTGLVIGGPAIPSAVIVCTNCGFMAQHALGVLGLLAKSEGT